MKTRRKLYADRELPKLRPITGGQAPERNKPCPCGSGVKFKKCHGAPPPPEPVYKDIYTNIRDTYSPEQRETELAFIKVWGFTPSPAQLLMYAAGRHADLMDMILRGLSNIHADPKFIFAVDKLHFLLTPKNKALYSEEEQALWEATLAEYVPAPTKETTDA